MAGVLYLVPTPIGNLEDITLRALRILRDEVTIIACEDTRQTSKLLQHFKIQKPLISYHDHNEASRAPAIIERLSRGENVALVSDAGTPLISDPGFRVVSAAIQGGFRVVPLPGASAALTALAGSGLPLDQFRFVGFLPQKSHGRRQLFQALKGDQATVITYESPHRILESLDEMAEILGDRQVVLARELTKVHEEFLRGTAGAILAELKRRDSVKGEITLIIERAAQRLETSDPAELVAQFEEQGMERMEAIKAAAKELGLAKRTVYLAVTEANSSSRDKHHG